MKSLRKFAPFVLVLGLGISACKRETPKIAVIPRTTALTIWEAAHAGAQFAAEKHGIQVYWNAPTSEDDIQQQAALIERIADGNYQGLILAPDQPLALMAPVQRAIAHGVRTVVIASPLPIPSGANLSYIVNDDEASGRMAAMRIGQILDGNGRVAVVGISPESLSQLSILHAFETTLEQHYPNITIVDRRTGTHNEAEAEHIADEMLSANKNLSAIFSLSAAASNGAVAALQSRGMTGQIRLVGFEQSVELANMVRAHVIDSIIAEDTYEMGYRAMELIAADQDPAGIAHNIKLSPTLLTRDNINSPQLQRLINMDWGRKP